MDSATGEMRRRKGVDGYLFQLLDNAFCNNYSVDTMLADLKAAIPSIQRASKESQHHEFATTVKQETRVVECDEKVFELSVIGRIKQKRRTKSSGGMMENANGKDAEKWKRIARLQLRAKAPKRIINGAPHMRRLYERTLNRGLSNKECNPLPPIVEIQESLLTQDSIENEDAALVHEIASLLSEECSHDLALVPSMDDTDAS